jgi:hypothetical protein
MPFIAPVQAAPSAQTAPGQQAAPAAHAMQVLAMPPPGLAQPRPESQAFPAQQACPLPPQDMHICVAGMPIIAAMPWQERPVSQRFAPWPPQHAPPELPQLTHVDGAPMAPAWQTAPEAVQVMPPPPPPQQGWPTAPHGSVPPSGRSRWHEPPLHVPAVPPPMHSDVAAVHVPPVQQPPEMQVLAAQHICPGAPQPPGPPPPPLLPLPHPAITAASASTNANPSSDGDFFQTSFGLICELSRRVCARPVRPVVMIFRRRR